MPGEGNLSTKRKLLAAGAEAILPPVLVVVLMQRWFVRGLVETEK